MKLDIKLNSPVHDIHPKEWSRMSSNKLDYIAFRNLTHFKKYVSKLTQIQDNSCGVTYKEAVADLLKNKSQFSPDTYESIRNLVRTNLMKRGLITEAVYESYKYDVDGIAVDVQKVIEGNPECMLKPAYSYTNYFYELYVNISYPGSVSNNTIIENMCKILATVEELERQHIYIKITVVDYSKCVDKSSNRDYLCILPLFSHKEPKSIETMSAIINDRLLRKFMFAMSEDIYGETLSSGYGTAIELPNSIRPIDLNEVELYESIYNKVIVPGTR